MKTKEIQSLYEKHILPTYTQLPLCPVKGKGSRIWDSEGREYLDFFPGWAVSGLGHCHPAVVHAIKNQARKILHIPNNFLNLKQARLAEAIAANSFPSRVFFCNSGAEATDGAIKFARRFGSSSGRYEIITMKKSFHGRTLGAIAATGQEKVRQGFAPILEGFRYADFNDLDSVKALVNEKTIAVFLEPVQGEGGIHIASEAFLRGLRSLCDEKNMLLMVDEVQCGMGRTGKMFAYQHYGIEPDVMTLAKSLGGGVPIGAFVVHERVEKGIMTPGSHGSTYGGNPLVAAAALAVFDTIKKEGLLKHTVEMGDYFKKALLSLKEKYPVIQEVRALGLMCALELSTGAAPVAQAALERGLLINATQETVIRILPAMTVTKKLIDRALVILDEALNAATDTEDPA